jgi:hypothetical protein
MIASLALGIALTTLPAVPDEPLTDWARSPTEWKGATVKNGVATLTADRWSYLLSGAPDHLEMSATITIREPGKQSRFFGEGWSVWPDRTFGDQGWDAALLLRSDDKSGYRVQLSHHLQQLAVVKYPGGGYLRSVACPIKIDTPQRVVVRLIRNEITVLVDGNSLVTYVDRSEPLTRGRVGIGVASGAKVTFDKVTIESVGFPLVLDLDVPKHVPQFTARKWLGDRLWVFDGDEPILLLPHLRSSYINNVKLRPGVKPLLSFNSHWDVQNQGAYPEAKNDTVDLKVNGGGKELVASWIGKHEKDRFATRSTMTVGYDADKNVYTYDIDSEMEVLPGPAFHFRYGFDFEHHTPLDPFNWQYLIFRRKDGTLNRRPVYPVDPGPQNDLETSEGLRVWYGRHHDPQPVCPAVEYRIPDAGKRKMNTAVCAAFYDTGVSFESETLAPGNKVHVRYRYTGYPTEEVEELFRQAKTYDAPTLDSTQHFIFAEWPKVTFSKFAKLSDTWPYGQVPFMTGHNRRPTYELAKIENGYAMKLGPVAFGQAMLPMKEPLAAGSYQLTVRTKGDNVHGPGGRIELSAIDAKGKSLLKETRYVGAGSFGWRTVTIPFELSAEAKKIALGFGNGGTGTVYFTDAEIAANKMSDAAVASATPEKVTPSPPGAIADYRFVEGAGHHALDFAGGRFGVLELANLEWTNDSGRLALRFTDDIKASKSYPHAGNLDLNYLRHPSYKARQGLPVALAGQHGGGFELPAFSVVTWIKPAAAMGKSQQMGRGDIVGVGARRMILRLVGQKSPYRLSAALNVNDVITTVEPTIEADRWCQVALIGEPNADKKWRVRLYVDGKQVQEGTTKALAAPMSIPPSLIFGAEIFYFHDAYYRGLIGRTLVFDRAIDEVALRGLRPVVE